MECCKGFGNETRSSFVGLGGWAKEIFEKLVDLYECVETKERNAARNAAYTRLEGSISIWRLTKENT